MNFEPTEDQQSIRSAVAALAAQFDDEYWLHKDTNHEFPREFY
ncbi:MAG: Acyl-CoA dehydrogenase, partial [Solirubrobacterales bacterium]|nr:Acyl-CoA dehydrogenase [Solirubrobacterales bacterium]MCW3041768.1 Acyl-CoA dehydrogenase [Solirubrobacterales bacterium]